MKLTTLKPPLKDSRVPHASMSPLRVRDAMGGKMRYRAILEAAPDAIVVVNQSGKIALINEQADVLFGYRRDELVGQPAKVLVSQHSRDLHRDQHAHILTAAAERPTVAGVELFGLRKDGSEFPAEIRLSPIDTKEGILVCSATRDISGRSRTEEDLPRLASIVACSDDAIIGKTLEGIITSWNAGAEQMYEYSARGVVGKPMSMLVPIDHPDEIPKALPPLIRGETVDHFETLRVRKDGEVFHVEITVSPIRDATEKIVGASAICRDISERNRREDDLSRLTAIVQSADDAIVGCTLEGIISSWNAGAERM